LDAGEAAAIGLPAIARPMAAAAAKVVAVIALSWSFIALFSSAFVETVGVPPNLF
jgi:hypothetical protein